MTNIASAPEREKGVYKSGRQNNCRRAGARASAHQGRERKPQYMPKLKNYTTIVPAGRSIGETEEMLVRHGATDITKSYEAGRLTSINFRISMAEGKGPMLFSLPLRWEKTKAVLEAQGVLPKRRSHTRAGDSDDDRAYRIAWKNLRDWVAANMVIVELDMVKTQEVFLPYAVDRSGKTLYQSFEADPARMLGAGK